MAERKVRVARRVINGVEQRKAVELRVGTAEDAGRLCVSPRSPNGVDGQTYRKYTRNLRTEPAPGPVQYIDPATGLVATLVDPMTLAQLYPLDEVPPWNAARRPGARTRATAENLRPTATRRLVLDAAAAGRLSADRTGRTVIGAEQQPPRVAQSVTELCRLGILELDEKARRYRLTKTGRQVLTRFGATS